MSDVLCPHCGQRMLTRLGVRLSPKLADIFDAVSRAGGRGLDTPTLCWMFYPNSPKSKAQAAVKVSINHINDLLVETDMRITMPGGRNSVYRLTPSEEARRMCAD